LSGALDPLKIYYQAGLKGDAKTLECSDHLAGSAGGRLPQSANELKKAQAGRLRS